MPKHLTNICALGLAASLVACAQPHIFTKAGADNQSFNADKLECEGIAKGQNGPMVAMGSLTFIAIASAAHQQAQQETFDTCMQARGYTLTIGQPVAATGQSVAATGGLPKCAAGSVTHTLACQP